MKQINFLLCHVCISPDAAISIETMKLKLVETWTGSHSQSFTAPRPPSLWCLGEKLRLTPAGTCTCSCGRIVEAGQWPKRLIPSAGCQVTTAGACGLFALEEHFHDNLETNTFLKVLLVPHENCPAVIKKWSFELMTTNSTIGSVKQPLLYTFMASCNHLTAC